MKTTLLLSAWPYIVPPGFRNLASDSTSQERRISTVTYDETNKRVRIIEDDKQGSSEDYYDTLYLNHIRRAYKVNLKTGQCNVTSTNRPFIPFGGASPFAKLVSETVIGAVGIPNESLTVQIWEEELEDKSRLVSTVTTPDCLPINSAFFSGKSGFIRYDFFDVTSGISDPTVFIPPSACSSK